MSLIMEALQRRAQGGTASPQMTATSGQLPTGGVNTPAPVQAPVQAPQTAMAGKPKTADPQKIVNNTVKSLMTINNPNFDDETRQLSKALMIKAIRDYS